MLRLAFRLSGFDFAICSLLHSDAIAYGGYSAGAVVAGISLQAIDRVDRIDDFPPSYPAATVVYEGLGLVPFVIVPHYRSEHPESAQMENVVASLEELNVPHQTLRDGEVIVVRK